MCRPNNALVVSYPATSRQTDQSGMIQRCDEQREARNKLEFLPTALMRPVRLPRRTTTTHASTASAFGACGSQFVPIATEDISLSLRSERTARGFVSISVLRTPPSLPHPLPRLPPPPHFRRLTWPASPGSVFSSTRLPPRRATAQESSLQHWHRRPPQLRVLQVLPVHSGA